MCARSILAGRALKLLAARVKLRIDKRDVEPVGDGGLHESFSKDLIAVNANAGAVPRTCKP